MNQPFILFSLCLGIIIFDHDVSSLFIKEGRNTSKNITRATTRQICADLCISGLGGPICGDMCDDNMGYDFKLTARLQLNDSKNFNYFALKRNIRGPRRSVCPLLCDYGLGKPLCGCTMNGTHFVNWYAICAAFCVLEDVRVYGCRPCVEYENSLIDSGSGSLGTGHFKPALDRGGAFIDWDKWCIIACRNDESGAACNCITYDKDK